MKLPPLPRLWLGLAVLAGIYFAAGKPGLRARQRDGGVAANRYRAGGNAAVRIPHVARDLRGGVPRERHDGRVGLDIARYRRGQYARRAPGRLAGETVGERLRG